jgi:hypothetical protein
MLPVVDDSWRTNARDEPKAPLGTARPDIAAARD